MSESRDNEEENMLGLFVHLCVLVLRINIKDVGNMDGIKRKRLKHENPLM